MPLVLTRIDDRLIHGQVVIGWGNYIHPDRIILCSDSIASSPWQRELYEAAGAMAMYNVTISIWTETETIHFFQHDDAVNKEKILLLVESPEDINRLVENHVQIGVVNVGGMHFKRGRRQIAPYIFVSDEDIASFQQLLERNLTVEGQDVPTSKKLDIAKLLEAS
ncbi:PTS sugar transporter subunit IIB [candidate division KSB1 bacterium]|nr:PTS sugar transporter subunit IIB [candidate division KSB1 bacterium]